MQRGISSEQATIIAAVIAAIVAIGIAVSQREGPAPGPSSTNAAIDVDPDAVFAPLDDRSDRFTTVTGSGWNADTKVSLYFNDVHRDDVVVNNGSFSKEIVTAISHEPGSYKVKAVGVQSGAEATATWEYNDLSG